MAKRAAFVVIRLRCAAGWQVSGWKLDTVLLHAVVSKELTASIGVSKIWSAGAMLGSHRPGCWISLCVVKVSSLPVPDR
jgi:hypothetical protein